MLAMHGSLTTNRCIFTRAICFACIVSSVPLVLALFALLRIDHHKQTASFLDKIVTQVFYSNTLWLRPQLCVVLLVLCIIINLPISQMIERKLTRRRRSKFEMSVVYFISSKEMNHGVSPGLKNVSLLLIQCYNYKQTIMCGTIYNRSFIS